MDDRSTDIPCSRCGSVLPRAEMFGVPPEMLCPECAQGHRKRLQVRVRGLAAAGAPVMTYVILGLAGGLFLLEQMAKRSPAAAGLFDGIRSAIAAWDGLWRGEIWRFLGTSFLHHDWIHLLFNCWWIFELGRATEAGFGRFGFGLLVVGSAMFSAGIEWMMRGPSIGLSGVVYGLALFLFVHRRTNPSAASVMNRRTLNFLLIWFVLCIFLTESGMMRIANWAHGGGAAWGYVAGLASLHARRRLLLPLCAAATLASVIFFSLEGGGAIRRLFIG